MCAGVEPENEESSEWEERARKARLEEVRAVACERVHQMFVGNRDLMKLVLFQVLYPFLPYCIADIPNLALARRRRACPVHSFSQRLRCGVALVSG